MEELLKTGSIEEKVSKKFDLNDLQVEYECKRGEILVRYITTLDANPETIDIISIHAASILNKQNAFSIDTIESVRSSSEGVFTRKFISFNFLCLLEHSEEPLTKLLSLIEMCTISSRIYLEVIYKLPSKEKEYNIEECSQRLEHLRNLVIGKAEAFYQKL